MKKKAILKPSVELKAISGTTDCFNSGTNDRHVPCPGFHVGMEEFHDGVSNFQRICSLIIIHNIFSASTALDHDQALPDLNCVRYRICYLR